MENTQEIDKININFANIEFYEAIERIIKKEKPNAFWGKVDRSRILITLHSINQKLPSNRMDFTSQKLAEIGNSLAKEDKSNLIEMIATAYLVAASYSSSTPEVQSSSDSNDKNLEAQGLLKTFFKKLYKGIMGFFNPEKKSRDDHVNVSNNTLSNQTIQNQGEMFYTGVLIYSYLAADFPSLLTDPQKVKRLVDFEVGESKKRQKKVLDEIWSLCREKREKIFDSYIKIYLTTDSEDKYKIKDQLEKIDKNWLDELLKQKPALSQYSCQKCRHSISKTSVQCSNCGNKIKDQITCLICGYRGRIREFKADICPSCGCIDGVPRNNEEAINAAIRMCQIFNRVGPIQSRVLDKNVIVKVTKSATGEYLASVID